MNLTDDDKKWILDQMAINAAATKADLERVETSLLTAFHKWASPMEMRMKTHREVLRTMDLETSLIN